MSFKSDFSLFPIKKQGNPNWFFKKATWPEDIEPEVHNIFDGKTTDSVFYTRTTVHNPRTQYCEITKEGNDIWVKPGDGYNFLVRKDSDHNKVIEQDDSNVPHEMLCVICFTSKRTHAVMECGHVSMCHSCSKLQYEANKECPICRTKMENFPIKLFFA
jgi:hypothetical protein